METERLFTIKKKSNMSWPMIILGGALVIIFIVVLCPLLFKNNKQTEQTTLKPEQVEAFSNLLKKINNKEHMADIQKTTQMDATGNLSTPTEIFIENSNKDVDNLKVDTMTCSRACCTPQWGRQNETDERIQPNDLGSKYFPTNYMCNGENPSDKGHGCVCVTKDGFDSMGLRGGNSTF